MSEKTYSSKLQKQTCVKCAETYTTDKLPVNGKWFCESCKKDLVTLPKEVAEAIETAKGENYTNGEIVSNTVIRDWAWDELKVLYTVKMDTLMQALVNGYTVEQTKEERLLALYERLDEDDRYEALELDGIRMALEILEITIPGINDKEEA